MNLMSRSIDCEAKLACKYTYQRMGRGINFAVNSTTEIYVGVIFSTPMRASPTVTLLSDVKTIIAGVNKSSSGATVLTNGYQTGAQILVGGFSGLTAGQAGTITENAAGSDPNVFAFDAELL